MNLLDMLWDTGAQVSITSIQLLQQHFKDISIRQLSELLDAKLNLTAVNGSVIPYIGWVEVRVKLDPPSSHSNQGELIVPFLVTPETLDCPILGYNVIEELVSQDQNSKSIIYKSFPQMESTKLDALVNFIQNSTSCAICKVRTGRKNVMVPTNSTIAVSCRASTGPVDQQTPVLFEPNQLAPLPEGLELYETFCYT